MFLQNLIQGEIRKVTFTDKQWKMFDCYVHSFPQECKCFWCILSISKYCKKALAGSIYDFMAFYSTSDNSEDEPVRELTKVWTLLDKTHPYFMIVFWSYPQGGTQVY